MHMGTYHLVLMRSGLLDPSAGVCVCAGISPTLYPRYLLLSILPRGYFVPGLLANPTIHG